MTNWRSKIATKTYITLLQTFERLFRVFTAGPSGTIPFKLSSWDPVKITVNTPYCDYDSVPLPTKLFVSLASRLNPDHDTTELHTFSHWATLQQRAIGDIIPPESEQDESLEDYLWNKSGSFFRKGLLVDFSYMEKYPVKKDILPYGGKIIFTPEGKIMEIVYRGQVYDTPPEWLLYLIRSTICVVSVIEMHLVRLHINTAQKNAILWRNSISKFTPLQQVITFNTIQVNRNIEALVTLFQNTYGFTKQGINQYILDCVEKGPLDTQEILGNHSTPWREKMTTYESQVKDLLKGLYGEYPEQLLYFILAVTAGHNQFGDAMIENLVVNGMFPPFIKEGHKDYRSLSYLQFINLQALAVFVSTRLPLFSDPEWWQHLDPVPCRKFQEWMSSQNEGWFNPSSFEISIGV